MDNTNIPDGAKEVPIQNQPIVELSRPEPNQKDSEKPAPDEKKWKINWVSIVISIGALCISLFSLGYNLGFIRPHEDHDVVARVLGVRPMLKGQSPSTTNAELVVDLAIINRGNQTEIIRAVSLCYSDTNNFNIRERLRLQSEVLNIQLTKGERRVLHISDPIGSSNTGRRLWLGLAVRAVAPNADDIEIVWPVCEMTLAKDGNGSSWSYDKKRTPLVQIISNKRMPHQKTAVNAIF